MDIYADIAKVDPDKQQVFGWASIVEKDGMPVIDKQGDMITIEELEKAAYNYVTESRVGGEMHQKIKKGDVTLEMGPKKVGTMIESFVITPEKIEKMGLPDDTPTGWWIGFQVEDDRAWGKVKKGDYKGFSIHGVGARKRLSKSEVLKMQFEKHLIGQHEQDDHNPNRKRNPRLAEAKAPHRRKDHRTKKDSERLKSKRRKGTKIVGGAATAAGTPFVVDTARQVAEGVPLDTAMRSASEPYKRIARNVARSVKKDDSMEEIAKKLHEMGVTSEEIRKHLKNKHDQEDHEDEEVEKHLIGSHDQDNHGRRDHGTSKDPNQLSATQRRQRGAAGITQALQGQHAGIADAASMGSGTTLFGWGDAGNWGRNIPLRDNKQVFQSDTPGMAVRGGLLGAAAFGGASLAQNAGNPRAALGALGAGAALGGGGGALMGSISDWRRRDQGTYGKDTRTFRKNDESDVVSVVKKLRYLGYSHEEISKLLKDNE